MIASYPPYHHERCPVHTLGSFWHIIMHLGSRRRRSDTRRPSARPSVRRGVLTLSGELCKHMLNELIHISLTKSLILFISWNDLTQFLILLTRPKIHTDKQTT